MTHADYTSGRADFLAAVQEYGSSVTVTSDTGSAQQAKAIFAGSKKADREASYVETRERTAYLYVRNAPKPGYTLTIGTEVLSITAVEPVAPDGLFTMLYALKVST